jgi:NitT/TauT family transport system ATP-binding protein
MKEEVAVAAPKQGNAAAAHVELIGVTKTYQSPQGDVTALTETNLEVRAGEFVTLLGPSGCGKSTLLRLVGGLDTVSSGKLLIHGQPVKGTPAGLGFAFQRDVLVDWRTILDNVLLPIEFQNQSRKQHIQRARELLALFGLAGFEDRRPWELSGGMRQRAAICRALINDPELLLMDEPFGAVDALTRDQLNVELQTIWQRSGKTVLFVTHSISEAIFLSDRIAVMAARPGRVVETVTIDYPRPRTLDIHEEPAFVQYSRQLRRILERHGAFAKD